jgi:hypothetical protein
MPPQDLFFLRALCANEADFLRRAVRVAARAAGRAARFEKTSVFAATDPSVDPIDRAKLIRIPCSFLARLVARLFSICSPDDLGDRNLFWSSALLCDGLIPMRAGKHCSFFRTIIVEMRGMKTHLTRP